MMSSPLTRVTASHHLIAVTHLLPQKQRLDFLTWNVQLLLPETKVYFNFISFDCWCIFHLIPKELVPTCCSVFAQSVFTYLACYLPMFKALVQYHFLYMVLLDAFGWNKSPIFNLWSLFHSHLTKPQKDNINSQAASQKILQTEHPE